MRLSFHGGAREVTGACHLLQTPGLKLLIDCGLYQGCEECPELNFADFGFKPKEIDAVVVTHAHLDHVGRLPKLVKEGFSGKIYSTAATRDLAVLILDDALHLAREEEALLYEEEDVTKTLELWQAVPYYEVFEIKNAKIKLSEAGHILGSAFVEIVAEGKHLLFTGDMGNVPSVLIPPPAVFHDIEYLITESTYGRRVHEPPAERILKLERAVEDAASRRGALLIPAFATERTQDILFLLNEMLHFKRVPEVPVFVDSPLAIRITEVFEKYPQLYREEIKELYLKHPHLFRSKNLRFTQSVEESKAINDVRPPKVIVAGSGMLTGGRILHHARRYLGDSKSIVLITGYQASNSLGRRLLDGVKEVKIFKEIVPVEAEIRSINGFSAHADGPQLFSFAERNKDALKKVFVVQGEEAEALHFRQEIMDRLGIPAEAPVLHEEFEI